MKKPKWNLENILYWLVMKISYKNLWDADKDCYYKDSYWSAKQTYNWTGGITAIEIQIK